MANILLSNPTISDMETMRYIWNSAFDSKDADLFFEFYYSQELTLVAKSKNKTVAMGYLFPIGDLVINEGNAIPTAVIYAVATLPEYRKLGLGTAISKNLISLARDNGYPAVVLWPAQDSLFDFYSSRSDMMEWFYTCEYKLTAPFTALGHVVIVEISPEKYLHLRENLLTGIPRINFSKHALEYQKGLSKIFGGGLFQIKSSDGDSCAIIERQDDDSIHIKELVMPCSMKSPDKCIQNIQNIVACFSQTFQATEFIVRTPAAKNVACMPMANIHFSNKRCAMLSLPTKPVNAPNNAEFLPWYGLAFD